MAFLSKILLSIGGFLRNAVAFCFEHWRIVLPSLVLAFLLWQIHSLSSQRDSALRDAEVATKALNDYVQSVNTLAAEQEAENKAKDNAAERLNQQNQENHHAEIQALKDQLAKRNPAGRVADDSWRDWLRAEVANGSDAGSKVASAGQEPTESGGGCDATSLGQLYVETLEIACAITTSDYNALRTYVDTNCAIYGCREPVDGSN